MTSTSAETKDAPDDNEFDYYFEKLVAFKKRNGHTKVPKHYSEDTKLSNLTGEWRRQFKLLAAAKTDEEKSQLYRDESLSLTPEQVQRLVDLGFEFSNKNPRHMRWDFRFQQLKEFVKQYGHTQVPIGWPENVKLANWVSTQRQEYKNMRKGRTSQLNESRIKLLNEIGFAWEVQRGGRRRQLGSPPADEDKAEGEGAAPILPGKALIVGTTRQPTVVPNRKKAKTSPSPRANQQPGSQQFPFNMVQQQQQMMMMNPWQGYYPPSDVHQGIMNQGMMNMGAPQWQMPPQAVMSNPGMNYQQHPVAASALQIMLAKSNNRGSRTRSDPPSDPPMQVGYGGGGPFQFADGMGAQQQQQQPQPQQQQQQQEPQQQQLQDQRARADPPSDPPEFDSMNGVAPSGFGPASGPSAALNYANNMQAPVGQNFVDSAPDYPRENEANQAQVATSLSQADGGVQAGMFKCEE